MDGKKDEKFSASLNVEVNRDYMEISEKELSPVIKKDNEKLSTSMKIENSPVQARAWRPRMGGARFQSCGSHKVKSACTAENFTKMGVKSTVFELQKSYKHKR